MTILKRLDVFDPKSRADLVLSRCSRPDVACWRPAHTRNLRVALFLERHAGDLQLPPGEARVRFAFRTWAPKPFKFRPTFVCDGGTLTSEVDAATVYIPAGRSDGRRFLEDLTMSGTPTLMAGVEGARVRAEMEFESGVAKEDLRELTVRLPETGDVEPRCPCC